MLTVVYLVLGTALDGISMIVLTSAVVLPMIQKAGFDLIWFGIFIVLLVEIARGHAAGRLQPVRAAEHDRQGQQHDRAGGDPVLRLPGRLHRRSSRVAPVIVTWLPDAVMGAQR